MLFHWQSIALSQKMDYWQNVVCIHKKFSSGSLSSSYGKRRLEVFDAMRVTYEKLKNNESFRRNRDVWDRICQKTLNWNREIISPDVTDAFDAGLQRFREDAVVQNWGANEKDEVASPASTVATSERDQTLQIPASVREDACADMQNLLPGLTQQMRDSIRELIFSDARDLPIERQLVRHIVASTNNRSEKKDVRLKKLIALLRYDMRVITQLF